MDLGSATGGTEVPVAGGGKDDTRGLRALKDAQHGGHRHSSATCPSRVVARVTRHPCFEMSVYWVCVSGDCLRQSTQVRSISSTPRYCGTRSETCTSSAKLHSQPAFQKKFQTSKKQSPSDGLRRSPIANCPSPTSTCAALTRSM